MSYKEFSDEDGKIGPLKRMMYENIPANEVCNAIEKGVFEDLQDFRDYLDSIKPPE